MSVLELEAAPAYYREQGLIGISAENWAENERQAHALAKAKNQR